MSSEKKSVLNKVSTLPDMAFVMEYLYCIGFFALLLVLLAVASFDPGDATLFNIAATSNAVTAETIASNIFGPVGATIADWFYQLFGFGALIFSFVFIAQLLSTFRKPTVKSRWALRLFGYPQLVICYLGLLTAITAEWRVKGVVFSTGGYVGAEVFRFFSAMFGRKGAACALGFGILASMPLCLGVRPVDLLVSLLTRIPELRRIKFFQGLAEKDSRFSAAPDVVLDEPVRSVVARREQIVPSPIAATGESRTVVGSIPTHNNVPMMDTSADSEAMVSPAEFQQLVEMLDYHTDGKPKRDPDQENVRLRQEAKLLEDKMATFGVLGNVVRSQPGPVVNVHEFEPAAGIKVTKVLGLQDDLALGLKAQSVLMAPQAGKSTIGIELPAQMREVVSLREIMESPLFQNNRAPLPMALGKLVDGSPLIADLSSMPHILIAGATGSGKSVGINSVLLSLMMNRSPKQLRLILVDPKMLELSNYDGIGHLLMPVVTDPQKAAGALKWALQEMERRYRCMKQLQVRNVASYNALLEANGGEKEEGGVLHQNLPYIVVVIDELCDLMMTAPKDVEDSVQRLAQKARAAGIHLVLATQRPSVDVLTGVIKANLPCRISFQVTSRHDSRTIIETIGAERLLGKGDMLFLPPGTSKLVRAHGAYVGDREINGIADRLRVLFPTRYEARIMDEVDRVTNDICQKNDDRSVSKSEGNEVDGNGMDENTLYERAVEFATDSGTVSTSSIQRQFRIGYNRAARVIDRMVKEGLVGPSDVAGKPRQVLVSNR